MIVTEANESQLLPGIRIQEQEPEFHGQQEALVLAKQKRTAQSTN
jgi:hypothetical protein